MRWGVTGSVGAGKTTVSLILADFGARVLDVDQVAAQALLSSSLQLTPAQALSAILTGGAERARVEAVLVPEVLRRIGAWCSASSAPSVLDAALLYEYGLDRLCDETLCLTCPAEERRRRVKSRASSSARLFDAIDAAQWPEAQKVSQATWTLRGDEPLDALRARLQALWVGAQR